MLAPCSRCGRHVRVDAPTCPFCGTAIRDVAAPPFGAASLLLGLALFGCAEGDDGEDVGTVSAPASMSDSSSTGDTSTGDVESGGGNDYGAAPPKTTDHILDDDELPEDEPGDEDTGGAPTEQAAPQEVPPTPALPLRSPRR